MTSPRTPGHLGAGGAGRDHSPSISEWGTAILSGVILAVIVWRVLIFGDDGLMSGGLVGGDIYPYYFPQKQVLQDAWARGTLPLWNDRTWNGYPMHAESQAGVFYPPNLLMYQVLDLNRAYNLSQLFHYVAAFVSVWRLCRSQRLSQTSSLFAAVIFVYGWFPVRISHEWSIIGGMWLPLNLWLLHRLLSRPNAVRWSVLSLTLAVQMLAGHFNLAFITQISCLVWAISNSSSEAEHGSIRVIAGLRGRLVLVAGAVIASCLLAAVQLVPTLELKHLSQREEVSRVFDPGYGHMPPVYLTQLVASWWYWHTPEIALSRELTNVAFLQNGSDTNPVEAHFYIGLIPLTLVLLLSRAVSRRQLGSRPWKFWLLLSAGAVIYSFGWLIPWLRHVPGFGFFNGPGRYTILASLGLSILAGMMLDTFLIRRGRISRLILTILVSSVTLADVLLSSQYPVADAQVVSSPPLSGLSQSWLRTLLAEEDARTPVRLLAPGPNVGNLLGVSCAPHYLGLGPAEYFSDDAALETQPESEHSVFPNSQQMVKLRRNAVTHILTTDQIAFPSEDCELIGSGPDSFLNRVWGRGAADCFLYRIRNSDNRIAVTPATALQSITWISRRPEDITFEVTLIDDALVELNELMYPGWTVHVDEQTAIPQMAEGSDTAWQRGVHVKTGKHRIRWSYDPMSFRIGAVCSVFSLIGLIVICGLPQLRTRFPRR